MQNRVQQRLAQLAQERDKGRRALAEVEAELRALEAEQVRLREQLLRIDGAIRVLEELREEDSSDGQD